MSAHCSQWDAQVVRNRMDEFPETLVGSFQIVRAKSNSGLQYVVRRPDLSLGTSREATIDREISGSIPESVVRFIAAQSDGFN
jgi:hypothetical protein